MVSHSTFKLLSRTADIPLPDLWIAIPHTEPNNGPTDTQQESPAMEQNTCKFLLLYIQWSPTHNTISPTIYIGRTRSYNTPL